MAARKEPIFIMEQWERQLFAFGVMSLFIIVAFVTGIFFGHILEKHHAFDNAFETEAKQVRKKLYRYRLKRMRGISRAFVFLGSDDRVALSRFQSHQRTHLTGPFTHRKTSQ